MTVSIALGSAAPAFAGENGSAPGSISISAASMRGIRPKPISWIAPKARGPCQAVAFPRVMADEKIVLPRNKPMESLRFLTLKGIRVQGGDPLLTLALYAVGLRRFGVHGHEQRRGSWERRTGPVLAQGGFLRDPGATGNGGGGSAPVSLCRAGARPRPGRPNAKA